MEQRKEIRTAIFSPVEVSMGKFTCREIIQDISFDGAFIETRRRLPIGESLILSFTFPSYEETISLPCRVVRNDAKGIGIRFTEPSAAAVTTIKEKSSSLPSA